MKRRIEQLTAYPFESDFSAPLTDTPDLITLSVSDLAALLEDARQSTADLVRNDALAQEAEKLSETARTLKLALAQIIDLAAQLEQAAIDEHDREAALSSIRRLASALIDGQADLFRKS